MEFKEQTVILSDGGLITIKNGNCENYGVYSNRTRIDSKEFHKLKHAMQYFKAFCEE